MTKGCFIRLSVFLAAAILVCSQPASTDTAQYNRLVSEPPNSSAEVKLRGSDTAKPIQKSKLEITAHRGDSATIPENTLMAIKHAIRGNADYVEIDIQETKDCMVVVLHDDNMKRVSGIAKNIEDCTFDEISQMDVGSWLNPKFSIARIPTLEEVLILCQGKIKLNIEIKADKHNHILDKTIALIEKYDFEEDCYITASSYSLLANVKKKNPNIKTGRICTKLEQIQLSSTETDMFSLYLNIVTEKLVKELHAEGKAVHVWTVNTKEAAQRMMEYSVDNIISNDFKLVQQVAE